MAVRDRLFVARIHLHDARYRLRAGVPHGQPHVRRQARRRAGDDRGGDPPSPRRPYGPAARLPTRRESSPPYPAIPPQTPRHARSSRPGRRGAPNQVPSQPRKSGSGSSSSATGWRSMTLSRFPSPSRNGASAFETTSAGRSRPGPRSATAGSSWTPTSRTSASISPRRSEPAFTRSAGRGCPQHPPERTRGGS